MKTSLTHSIKLWKPWLSTFVFICISCMAKATSYTWTGAINTHWGNPNNWSPAGVPDLDDNVTIVSGSNSVTFDEISPLNNFTISSGSLNLGVHVLQITGSAVFSGGSISNSSIICTGSSVVFSGTVISSSISITSASVQFNGSVFNNPVTATYNGSANVSSNGGNTFNSTFTFTSSGSGNYTFQSSSADIFKGNVTLTNSGSGIIFMAHSSTGNQFQENIIVNSTGSSLGIRFGQNSGSAQLFSGKTITIGGSGFSSGDLRLRNFTQSGSTAQTLTSFSSTTGLYLESGTTFNGDVTFTAPQVFLDGSTFNGTATITKSGASNNLGNGGNTFNGATSLRVTGTGDLGSANGSSADIFNGVLTCEVTGSGTILLAHSSSGTQFNQNINLISTGLSSKGVRFGQNGGSSTLASGRELIISSNQFSRGQLRFRNFTQAGSTTQNLSQTSGNAQIHFESGTTFNGNITVSFPQVFLSGTTFNGTASITKNGATENIGSGGNTFASSATIVNSGSGRLVMADINPDVFTGTATFTNSGSSQINVAHKATGTTFAQNITFNSTAGNGILFGQDGGTASLASGRILQIGSSGFTNGTLAFRNFTQTGATDQELIDFTDDAQIAFQSGSTFNGALLIYCPSILLSGSTFNGEVEMVKSGSSTDYGAGGCTFNQATILRNEGDGDFVLGFTAGDVFNAILNVQSEGNALVSLAYRAGTTQFNQNITLNSTNSSGGIYFGDDGGSATLANGKTINIGTFDSGSLRFRNFTQSGSTAQTLNGFGSNVDVYMGAGCTFNGQINLTAPGIFLNGTTFNGVANITKTGNNNNTCVGNNVFNGTTTISNTGSGALYMANTQSDDFNAAVTFIQTNANTLYPAYTRNSTFAFNVSTTGTSQPVEFGANGGWTIFDGSVAQSLTGSGANRPVFSKVRLDKSGGTLNLSVPLFVSDSLRFTSGRIVSSGTNPVIFADNAVALDASNASFVRGPVRKDGDDAFVFPVGKVTQYRPIAISAPSTTSASFVAEYFLDNSNSFYPHGSRDASIHHLSSCEFWTLDRTASTASVSVTLSFNAVSCGITNLADLLVCRWDGSTWKDHGNGSTTGSTVAGTVTSSGAISSFSPFTLGSSTAENPMPIELIHFSATPKGEAVSLEWVTASEVNNDFFTIERSANGKDFTEIGRVSGQGNSNVVMHYQSTDYKPLRGLNYYRLRQTDFDGQYSFSPIEAVYFGKGEQLQISLAPNPAKDQTTLRFSDKPTLSANARIEIRDMNGVLAAQWPVFQESINTKEVKLDLSRLPAGAYFVRISDLLHSATTRLIVQP